MISEKLHVTHEDPQLNVIQGKLNGITSSDTISLRKMFVFIIYPNLQIAGVCSYWRVMCPTIKNHRVAKVI